MGAQKNRLVGRVWTGGCHGTPVALESVATRGEAERVVEGIADEANPAVAQVEQMLRCELAARDVVAQHAWKRARVLACVDEDNWHTRACESCHILGGRRERHDQQTICALAEWQRLEVLVSLFDRLDVVDDKVELAVCEGGIDAAKPFRCLWTRQEGNDDGDGLGLAEAEPPRREAGREVEFRSGCHDAPLGVFVDE